MKPIVYGNTAKYFGKKRDEDGHTHEWSFYIKAYENEVISTHCDFTMNKRDTYSIKKGPFNVYSKDSDKTSW